MPQSFISTKLIFGMLATFVSLVVVGILLVWGRLHVLIGLTLSFIGIFGIAFGCVGSYIVYDDRRKAARLEHEKQEAEEKRLITMKQDVQNFMKAGRYEDAASLYDQLGMWEEAGECRKMARTNYVIAVDVHVGKDGISVNCPLCGSSARVESKSSEVTCKYCGQKYYIPKKILDLI